MSREGRPKEKAPEARAEPRDQGEAEAPMPGTQLVHFGSLRSERNDAGAGELEEDRPWSSRSTQEERHATSTPTGSDREQRLKEGLEEVSGIRGTHLPRPAPRREVSPGRSSSRRMYPSPTESFDDEYDSYTKAGRGRRAEGRSSRGSRTSGAVGTSGTGRSGEERTAPKKGSRPAPAGQPQRDQAGRGHPQGRRGMWTRRGT